MRDYLVETAMGTFQKDYRRHPERQTPRLLTATSLLHLLQMMVSISEHKTAKVSKAVVVCGDVAGPLSHQLPQEEDGDEVQQQQQQEEEQEDHEQDHEQASVQLYAGQYIAEWFAFNPSVLLPLLGIPLLLPPAAKLLAKVAEKKERVKLMLASRDISLFEVLGTCLSSAVNPESPRRLPSHVVHVIRALVYSKKVLVAATEWGLLAHACDYFVLEMGQPPESRDRSMCRDLAGLLASVVNRYGKLTNHCVVRSDVCAGLMAMLVPDHHRARAAAGAGGSSAAGGGGGPSGDLELQMQTQMQMQKRSTKGKQGKAAGRRQARGGDCGGTAGVSRSSACQHSAAHTLAVFSQDAELACPLILAAITEQRAFGALSVLLHPGAGGQHQEEARRNVRVLLTQLSRWSHRYEPKMTLKLNQFLEPLLAGSGSV